MKKFLEILPSAGDGIKDCSVFHVIGNNLEGPLFLKNRSKYNLTHVLKNKIYKFNVASLHEILNITENYTKILHSLIYLYNNP